MYNSEYRDYYDKIRKKFKGKNKKNLSGQNEDTYLSSRNLNYKRGSFGSDKREFKYLDKLVIRLICTFLLFLGAFTLKTAPGDNTKKLYDLAKNTIGSEFNQDSIRFVASKVGLNYDYISTLFQNQYTNVMNEIKKMDN